jgi:hypothetical protein
MTTVQEEFEFRRQESKTNRGPKTKYVPVYHVELVRDRSTKGAPPTAIQSVAMSSRSFEMNSPKLIGKSSSASC